MVTMVSRRSPAGDHEVGGFPLFQVKPQEARHLLHEALSVAPCQLKLLLFVFWDYEPADTYVLVTHAHGTSKATAGGAAGRLDVQL